MLLESIVQTLFNHNDFVSPKSTQSCSSRTFLFANAIGPSNLIGSKLGGRRIIAKIAVLVLWKCEHQCGLSHPLYVLHCIMPLTQKSEKTENHTP